MSSDTRTIPVALDRFAREFPDHPALITDDRSWDDFMALGTAVGTVAARAAAVTPDDLSDILFTSGTTGRSKGVLRAHRQWLDGSASWAAGGKITSTDRYPCIDRGKVLKPQLRELARIGS